MDAPPAPVTDPPPSSGPPPLDDDRPGDDAPPPAAEAPNERRPFGVHRVRQAGLLGGVCAGIGMRLGLRSSIVRVAFVAAAVLGGIGVIAYGALWLALPDEDVPRVSRLRTFLAIALVVLGTLLLLSWVPMPPAEILWPGLLLGIGAALWQPDALLAPRAPSRPKLAESPPAPPHTPRAPVPPEPPPPAARPPQVLGRVTIAAALAAVGVGLILDRTDLFDVSTYHLVAVVLLVLGVGLVVGTFLGRARWLLLVAIPLVLALPVAGTFTSLDVDPLHHLGDRTWRVPNAASVAPLYENGTGRTDLFVGGASTDDTDGATVIRHGIGAVVVTVPPGMTVELHGRAGWGRIEILDERVDVVDTPDGEAVWSSRQQVVEREGRDAELDYVLDGDPDGGRLTVDAVIGFGVIEVRRMAPQRDLER
jgi:phage shock protein PspC (stress-responsive transcriptional regulator)